MKVFDLQCHGGSDGHVFEGWFGSEEEFRDQVQRGLLACPVCGDTQVARMPSAPRLNLSAGRPPSVPEAGHAVSRADAPADDTSPSADRARLQAAWWRAAREAIRNAEDVGSRFADEARRMHHGDTPERGIRGEATVQEVRQLLDEGVSVLPVPGGLNETLQ